MFTTLAAGGERKCADSNHFPHGSGVLSGNFQCPNRLTRGELFHGTHGAFLLLKIKVFIDIE